MSNIILQKIVEKKRDEVPAQWLYRDLKIFGLDWKLFEYQKKALENITALLYLVYNDYKQNNGLALERNKRELFQLYRKFGLTQEISDQLDIKEENENFKFLSSYFPAGTRISFESFINRVAFWMATGSGKTLVMIKLLAILADLINKDLIPQKDILILAPKDEILSQIKDHINKFNKGAEITINLRNLKEWEKIKNQQSIFNKNEINVFYYRADNIADRETVAKKKNGQRINYESIYNNGDWYLILDEAHKGEKETSKRQQYFIALTQNGFLFNFSATFTDEIDIATTIFDYKLDTFLKDGYGKKLYIADSDFKNFNKSVDDDFSFNEKKDIIAQTLIIFSLAKSRFNKLQSISKKLYHAPLLITLANSVNTEEADLKIFYKLLAEIAKGKFDFERTKRNLVAKMENKMEYLFELGGIDQMLISEIQNLKKQDFFKLVFNAENQGNIEIVKFKDNSRELAFKLVGASKYFMLIVASDIIKWENNVLDGYEFGGVIEESFFEDINKKNDINILLGSRIFAEGWDTNRPNIINFINIGVSDDAKKFVLQSIGRGIRIEPISNQRKRFEYLDNSLFADSEIKKIEKSNNLLESLFVFATNKEVVKNILEGLEKQANQEWIKLEGINKNEEVKESELPIFIPVFESDKLNNKPFWIGKNEYNELSRLVNKNGPKVLLLKRVAKIRTFNKVKNKNNFKIDERRRKKSIENILFIADNYFNESVKKLSEIKILDGEISNYKEVRTNIEKDEVKKIEKDILKITKPKKSSSEIFQMVKDGKISQTEFEKMDKERIDDEEIDTFKKYLEFKMLEEHYYSPILFKKDTEHFQHIIKKETEINFLHDLKEYLTQENNKLKDFDWWYFSKIDEAIDRISIPYFDSKKGEYRMFFPDFIFWFKKDDKYYLKFIDPHGIEYTGNSTDKIDGFLNFVDDFRNLKNKKFEKVEMFYYNELKPSKEIKEEYKKYWTNDFNRIFRAGSFNK
ncbi:MAG: DEAD/DEAH box helicase family protein [Candidatus Falkowbacteria bacterium]